MEKKNESVFVYAGWLVKGEPKLIGTLLIHPAQGAPVHSFNFSEEWLASNEKFFFDPDITWYTGTQYPYNKNNFGIIFDSMPDSWGKMLIRKMYAKRSKKESKQRAVLQDIDYLIAVNDHLRSGGLRFKTDVDGPFVSEDPDFSVPPWTSVRTLQNTAMIFEEGKEGDVEQKWLEMLVAPGSSLGGARPKANIVDDKGNLWIAKFPSRNDKTDTGAWEFLVNKLARKAGITVPESVAEIVTGKYHTFLTKRFDREKGKRIHFSSAMTMTGYTEELLRDKRPSYLELAEFIQYQSSEPESDLKELWKRIIFNIAVSNTDDHLRNHGFLLGNKGWRLSPAYDLNPSVEKPGLALNIDLTSNDLDYDLAISTGDFFGITITEMKKIIREVHSVIKNWKKTAVQIGINKQELEMMEGAFRV